MERVGDLRPANTPRAYGSVALVPESSTDRTKVELVVTLPANNRSANWAILPDRCGSGGAPVLPVASFETLDASSSGRVQTTAVVLWRFPTEGSYHVDIYQAGAGTLKDVITCANLRFTPRPGTTGSPE
jgi:hypothetical protein